MSPNLCWKHAILVTAAFFYLSSPEARRFSLWIITLSFVFYLVSRTCILNFGIFFSYKHKFKKIKFKILFLITNITSPCMMSNLEFQVTVVILNL